MNARTSGAHAPPPVVLQSAPESLPNQASTPDAAVLEVAYFRPQPPSDADRRILHQLVLKGGLIVIGLASAAIWARVAWRTQAHGLVDAFNVGVSGSANGWRLASECFAFASFPILIIAAAPALMGKVSAIWWLKVAAVLFGSSQAFAAIDACTGSSLLGPYDIVLLSLLGAALIHVALGVFGLFWIALLNHTIQAPGSLGQGRDTPVALTGA